ncbi:MAG: hypothetical protein NTV00_03895 [Methylococcales bacterium]|nr:hypothetical protein [Methylococcales bacterium]
MKCNNIFYTVAATASMLAFTSLNAAPTIFSGTGNAATTEFNNFKAAIKSATNVDGSAINWDAVKLDGTDASPKTRIIQAGKTVEIPVDRFKNRGVIFADPYSVSSDGFATANPATAQQFPAFSVNNTFAMFDSKNKEFKDFKIEQNFVLLNTDTKAGTRGFGAIFLDVEQVGSSTIEYFGRDAADKQISLGKYYVKAGSNSGEAQFLGVLFDSPVVTDVEITPGVRALFSFDGKNIASFGAEDLNKGIDLAVTDDFFFAVPETAKISTVKTSDADCLLNWAERNYSGFFYPAGSSTLTYPPYNYRYYKNTNSYLGVSYSDNHVYYLDGSGKLLDAGDLNTWLNTSKCK